MESGNDFSVSYLLLVQVYILPRKKSPVDKTIEGNDTRQLSALVRRTDTMTCNYIGVSLFEESELLFLPHGLLRTFGRKVDSR